MSSGVVLTQLLFLGQEGRAGHQARPRTQLANRMQPKTVGFQFFSTLFSFGEFRVFNFLIFSNLPPWGCVKLIKCARSLLTLLVIHLLFGRPVGGQA